MVEIPPIKENLSFEDNFSWKDIQGLICMLYDEAGIESIRKNTYSHA